jgi:hypothetical protein
VDTWCSIKCYSKRVQYYRASTRFDSLDTEERRFCFLSPLLSSFWASFPLFLPSFDSPFYLSRFQSSQFMYKSEIFIQFLAYFPYVEKNKVGLCDHVAACASVSVCVRVSPLLTSECLTQSLWNLVHISRHLSPSHRHNLKNPSHQSVCRYVYPSIVARQRFCKNSPIVARQRLGRNGTAVTNTHASIEELLDASFLVCPLSGD